MAGSAEGNRGKRGYGRRDNTHGRPKNHKGRGRGPRRDDRDNNRGRRGGRKFDREDNRRGSNRDHKRSGERKHAQRAGQNQRGFRPAGPQRSGYREERLNTRSKEPAIPEGIDPRDLDGTVRQELRSLSKDNADMVAKHLIMTATLLDEEPKKALEHARAAKNRAGRVAVARETNGIAAYHAGEWKEAISELRAARRMSGGPGLLPVLADAERGLGQPKKALEVAHEFPPSSLEPEQRGELAIIVAGAHQDLQQYDEAVLALQPETVSSDAPEVTKMRVYYAYGDALTKAKRALEAIEWFEKAQKLDKQNMLDSRDRIAEINKTTN